MIETAKRMKNFHLSIFTELMEEKEEFERRTHLPVLDFSLGSPDISPSQAIMDAMEEAVTVPENYKYAVRMLPEMREAIIHWYNRRFQVELLPDEITLLQGSQEALVNLPLIFCDPDDGVLVPDPYYPVYVDAPMLAQAEILFMPLKEERNYLIDLDAISEEERKKAKMMIVCYPNNPTGAIAPDWFIEELIRFAKDNDILVVYDNAYADLNFADPESRSFLSFEGAMDIGVEINSFSKSYGMAGARLGVLAGNRQVIQAYRTLKSNMDYGVFLPVQYAGMTALESGRPLVEHTRKAYFHRQQLMIDLFAAQGWILPPSQGTMFIWAPIPEEYEDSISFARDLLLETGILVTPGSSFGHEGDRYVRIALVQPDAVIEEAAARLSRSNKIRDAVAGLL